ncbi:MBL fold metallo-hydrolase, partial [Intestinibacillus massiliensis]|nr:MBL fold metallo-hydrolase [Intestinibacillus massiliensis]
MFELIQAGKHTYYIDNPNIMGVYQLNEEDVCLIDTGNGDKAAEAIDEILEKQGWKLKFILNTHTHIDHLGGNRYLMKK